MGGSSIGLECSLRMPLHNSRSIRQVQQSNLFATRLANSCHAFELGHPFHSPVEYKIHIS